MVRVLKTLLIYLLCTALVAIITMIVLERVDLGASSTNASAYVTTDSVSVTAKVTGFVEAKQTAKLAFPMVGTVKDIFYIEGEHVSAGDIIASLTQDPLLAEYTAAQHNLRYLTSVKQELLNGPREEARTVTKTNVDIAQKALLNTQTEQAQLVQNAYRKLLSSELEAIPENPDTDDTPPTVSGSYECEDEGVYTLSVFRSSSPTGYSYRLSGLEEGTFTAWVDTPTPLGNCGLLIQFDADEAYRNSDWTITVPNKRSSSYITNVNAYQLALEQQRKAISAAELALKLAQESEVYSNANPTTESITQINAKIEAAKATVATYEAQIANYTIRAPFDGIITRVDIEKGEAADLTKTISLISEEAYSLKARIPEVDIKNITTGKKALITFDASPDEQFSSTITYISPQSIDIDGVAYYEARLILTSEPDWIREGLNADIEIIIERKDDALVVPKQYLDWEDGQFFISLLTENGSTSRVPVETGIIGNDGYIEVTNVPAGTPIILP